ncbi:type IX secretion system outer membrane channel protein PorV [Reichenbachiella carrageenanivorans]|uniref:Type IX secretion system outer membrane channel protein PorV n=1 Tax=Reichenbachiella carrageenanivorans TaxID=2979869 RepID=A0ABY6D2K5_9BACT|nr:type IX secretion system outer membrane channel protein PorV [Reichenbachiella carrageenanivorans]UXX80395.1 type IX secretion system outer membrane channel protein PorV [Reichenbachiella carrageenanivorans]
MTTTTIKRILLASILSLPGFMVSAQTQVTGQEGADDRRVITTAVPFVSFAPDSRASGMGDAGVATSPDANSVHWNNGKLAFIEHNYGASLSYSPWLGKIVDDMSLTYLSGYYKLDRIQTLGLSMRYFDLGEIHLTDLEGSQLGIENPREVAFDGTYSRKLTEKIGIGVTARYIWSNLVGSGTNAAKPASSFAVDLGFYYTNPIVIGGKDSEISFGTAITNIGQKMTYGTQSDADFIPINLRVGTALKVGLDAFNSLTFALDLNKLMVPTPPIYDENDDGSRNQDNNGNDIILKGKDPNRNLMAGMFGSFTDAPDGFSEEMQEIMIATGVEYWYKELFAARLGYFYENKNKGGRQYMTLGLGFRYQKFGIDFSYLVPGDNNHPLAETIRFSLLFNFDKAEAQDTTLN